MKKMTPLYYAMCTINVFIQNDVCNVMIQTIVIDDKWQTFWAYLYVAKWWEDMQDYIRLIN